MAVRKVTDYIVIHCSATRPSMDIGAKEIDKWHRAPPRNWSKIGYHYIIRRDGTLETGRRENEVGAHAEGFNSNSVSVCWVGGVEEDSLGAEDNRTPEQKARLVKVVDWLKGRYPNAKIVGHRDLPNVKKACPSFDVSDWLKEVGL
jgi:N-acetylmuramoyl-L-alanine amidase